MASDFGYQTNEKEQEKDIVSAINNEHQEYVVIETDDKPIGYIRIDWMDMNKEFAWLRFALGEDRGKGYAKKALQLYIKELFGAKCKRIEGEVYQYNIPSQKVLESIGFVLEGVKRKAHYTGSDYVDVFSFGLLKEDFSKNRG
jgi:RimJ/RimL family protein N-acetyltransferase